MTVIYMKVYYLISGSGCKVCGIQYVGSTTTNFRSRFNNHRSRINAHLKLSSENKRNDDFLYQHFHSSGHLGLSHLTIQLIDRAMGERELWIVCIPEGSCISRIKMNTTNKVVLNLALRQVISSFNGCLTI